MPQVPTVEDSIFWKLSGDPEVARHVENRIYPLRLPDNPKLPAIVFTRISTFRSSSRTQYGESLPSSRFQFECYGKKLTEVGTLAAAVENAFDGFRGEVENMLIVSQLVDERDSFDDVPNEFRRDLDFFVWYKEAD